MAGREAHSVASLGVVNPAIAGDSPVNPGHPEKVPVLSHWLRGGVIGGNSLAKREKGEAAYAAAMDCLDRLVIASDQPI